MQNNRTVINKLTIDIKRKQGFPTFFNLQHDMIERSIIVTIPQPFQPILIVKHRLLIFKLEIKRKLKYLALL